MNTAEALDRLLLYRQTPESLLRRLMDPAETVRTAAQAEVVALAVENGWQGGLWRCCIAWTLTEHENPFSLSWERRTGPEDTLSALALADMAVFHALLSTPPERNVEIVSSLSICRLIESSKSHAVFSTVSSLESSCG
mgnify:CR=1 FL=1